MFYLAVLISLLASNSYGVVAVTLDATLLIQLGNNNQSSSVYINGNNITDIDPNAFNGYTQLKSLSIQQSALSKIDLGLFKDLVNLQSLDFSYNPSLTQLTNSKKIAFPFIQSLLLNSCPLPSLDSNVINALPNLTQFYAQNANPVQLSPLKANQLSAWKKLQTLGISTKNQASLTKECFNGLGSLESLAFMYSNIKQIEVHSLLALPNVNNVDFSDNEITAFEYLQIPSNLILLRLSGNKMNYFRLSKTMGYLKYLYLDNNLFRSFRSMDFTFLATNLTYLELSNNPHAYPNEIAGHMRPLVNLVQVFLNNLSISSIDSNFFKQNSNLFSIQLNHNKISTLPFNTFSHLKGLTVLELTYNRISVLDNRTFVGLNYLRSISLSFNNITKLAPRTFYNLNMLLILDFTFNSISEIDSSAFIGCYNLRFLYLNNNRLTKISPGTFENLTLNTLTLSNNQLTELDNSMFAGLVSVVLLEIHSNKISKIAPGTFYGFNITTLNLEWNLLIDLDNDTFVGQNQLAALDLSNNMLSSFKPGTFNILPNLMIIDLSYNNLIELDNSTFAGCNKLQQIQLYNNPSLPKANLQSLCPSDAVNCKVYY